MKHIMEISNGVKKEYTKEEAKIIGDKIGIVHKATYIFLRREIFCVIIRIISINR